jgi:hypothetical protein
MTSALERLSIRVRQAESKSRSGTLRAETLQAVEALRAAEERFRMAEKRFRDEGQHHKVALADAEADSASLKELTHKIAELVGTGDILPKQLKAMTAECDVCRTEIAEMCGRAGAALAALTQNVTEAKRALQTAIASYAQSRNDVDRLQPQLATEFSAADRLATSAAMLLPAGQLHALASEIDGEEVNFAALDPHEQLAQLKVWIGGYRRLQALGDADFSENERALRMRLFPRIVALSKQYEPGYIDAFRQGFEADWNTYIADAEEQLRQASEHARLRKRRQEVETRRIIAM